MTVYKTFFKLAKKRLPGAMIYFIIFIIISIIISQTSIASNSQFTVKSVSFACMDDDHSPASAALIDYLSKRHKFTELNAYDTDALQENMFYGKVDYIVIIPNGFAKSLTTNSILPVDTVKRADSANGYFMDQQIEQFLNSISGYLEGGFSMEEALKQTTDSKLATTTSSGGLILPLQRGYVTARPEGRYRKH